MKILTEKNVSLKIYLEACEYCVELKITLLQIHSFLSAFFLFCFVMNYFTTAVAKISQLSFGFSFICFSISGLRHPVGGAL